MCKIDWYGLPNSKIREINIRKWVLTLSRWAKVWSRDNGAETAVNLAEEHWLKKGLFC